jgi:hypothetical protein
MTLPSDLSEEELEAKRVDLETTLKNLCKAAEAWAGKD